MASARGAEPPPPSPDPEAIPLGQRLYDRVFLLLVTGIVIMVLVYTGWGIWEIMTMPAATLP